MESSNTPGNNCFWDGQALHWSGSTRNGVIGVTDPNYTNGITVALPQAVISGSEDLTDVFVDNSGITTGRLLILTDRGNLYSCGDNTSGVATGGFANVSTANTTVGISKIIPVRSRG
jgi:hypothetical protein